MDEDVRRSRLRISRRRALGLGGAVGLAGVLAACGTSGTGGTSAALPSALPADVDVVALLDRANTCAMTAEETQGPYWFDVDAIRSDLREDRPGARLELHLRVQDASCTPIPNAVVEIWHCDAGGVYSGFEQASTGGPGGAPPGSPGAGSGTVSDGSYVVGESEATPTDDGTYLRGAQVTDARGIATFTTIYPGWYRGRTVHIHLKVHRDRTTVLTSQLYADDAYTDSVYTAAPYSAHTGRDTLNTDDSIYDETGLMTIAPQGDGHLAVINIGT